MTSYTVTREDLNALGLTLNTKSNDVVFIAAATLVLEYGTPDQLDALFTECKRLNDKIVPIRLTLLRNLVGGFGK